MLRDVPRRSALVDRGRTRRGALLDEHGDVDGRFGRRLEVLERRRLAARAADHGFQHFTPHVFGCLRTQCTHVHPVTPQFGSVPSRGSKVVP